MDLDDQRDHAEEAYNAELLRNPDGVERDRARELNEQLAAVNAVVGDLTHLGEHELAAQALDLAAELRIRIRIVTAEGNQHA
jgi:hypothetical protein